MSDSRSILERLGEGIRDPIEQGAQTIPRLLPKEWVDYLNWLNNMAADKTGLVGLIPPGGMDAYEARRDSSIQAARGGATGEDWWRDAGNALSPANLLPFLRLLYGLTTPEPDTQRSAQAR